MKKQKKQIKQKWSYDRTTYDTIAFCPYCEQKHKIRLSAKWTGNGLPRVYHKTCKKIIDTLGESDAI